LAFCVPAEAFTGSPLVPVILQQQKTTPRRCALTVQASTQQEQVFFSRRRMMAAAAMGGGAVFVAPEGAGAVKAGPKLEQWDQWAELVEQEKLSKVAYNVLHNQATERPFTSALLKEKRVGTYACAACDTDLFVTKTKFDSGTGWPSFYDKLAGVELETGNWVDKLSFMCEVHCEKCGGHLGHVFDDGILWQVPSGKRYCINGASLTFKPKPSNTEEEGRSSVFFKSA